MTFGSIPIKAVKGLYGCFMNLFGIKGLASIAVIVLLVSGCSTQNKSDYDLLEVIEYEKCLDASIKSTTLERTLEGREEKQVWRYILEFCEAYKPTKQG